MTIYALLLSHDDIIDLKVFSLDDLTLMLPLFRLYIFRVLQFEFRMI